MLPEGGAPFGVEPLLLLFPPKPPNVGMLAPPPLPIELAPISRLSLSLSTSGADSSD
ncbi:hypothetical protein SAMD00019534_107050 [Acytostelium subglobosum LB1]|uniref:hypothetical protein n=1 Tax=Acytostelium subglobosum LB1 TaxID=1410327 RepID=UPI000644EC2D|nr:hypothetical protein SAMD00019534_107050 [Acytostelium subglobosum LB1]GAM27529.1 hypothetical protein SAMD00019534_107050 [Acytostelium subglobosum LB1]|eukprot:XP_012749594.1 hypothetical protein SAMD00019534_107050 [Acytostelium subglobosum LB1]